MQIEDGYTEDITTFQYDNKKNYLNFIQFGFPEEPKYKNINNLLASEQKRDGRVGYNPKYEYVYNSKGLPIKFTKTPPSSFADDITTLEYIDCE
jgi:hypothetical protein